MWSQFVSNCYNPDVSLTIWKLVTYALSIYIFMAVNIPCFILTWLYIKEPERCLEEVVE